MSAGANDGTYAGLGAYQSGGGGGGLHSLVHTLREKLGSHCAELVTQCVHTLGSHRAQLTPGVATITAANGNNATATPAARRRTNLVTQASRDGPDPDIGLLELMPYYTACITKSPIPETSTADLSAGNQLQIGGELRKT